MTEKTFSTLVALIILSIVFAICACFIPIYAVWFNAIAIVFIVCAIGYFCILGT